MGTRSSILAVCEDLGRLSGQDMALFSLCRLCDTADDNFTAELPLNCPCLFRVIL